MDNNWQSVELKMTKKWQANALSVHLYILYV